MPWKGQGVMEVREEFVLKALEPEVNFKELCKEYEISRKSGYKWKERFLKLGRCGLKDLSRRPLKCPHKVPSEVVLEIVRLKFAHKSWGPRKIRKLLIKKHGIKAIPSRVTVSRILDRAGLVVHRPKRRRYSDSNIVRKPVEVNEPNDLWTVDFKGWWKLSRDRRCEPLTIRDEYSRFILSIKAMNSTTTELVREEFERIFMRYGLPKVIRSDNGRPFATTQSIYGLTQLSAWWVILGIELDRIDPGHPEQNGGHERMHRDIRQEIQGKTRGGLNDQQAALDIWKHEFNFERPHEALDMKTPSDVYRRSKRMYTGTPSSVEYSNEFAVRKVKSNGQISFNNRVIFVSNSLKGWEIGLRYNVNNALEIWFDNLLLGEFNEETNSIVAPKDRRKHCFATQNNASIVSLK